MEGDIESMITISDDIRMKMRTYGDYVTDLCSIIQDDEWKKTTMMLMKKYKFKSAPRRIDMVNIYRIFIRIGRINRSELFEKNLIKTSFGKSGVMVVTIATKPDRFSCCFDCHYCPNEQGQPRSYLSSEQVLSHAAKMNFDTVEQFYRRAIALYCTENELDKLEVIVLGGTWSCYNHDYQEEFIRDIYYAANTIMNKIDNQPIRNRLPLCEEQTINETTQCRIISITLETRPDMINEEEIKRLRRYGCTRIQIGVQHIDDDILRFVNRRCYYSDIVRAIKMLKDNGFKVDIHIMPNLPSSTPEKDIDMFSKIINSSDLQVDQWKIYPCMVVDHTRVYEWYTNGSYIPYSEEKLREVLKYAIINVPYHIRINRIVRDIPLTDVIAGVKSQSMRDDAHKILEIEGLDSRDIRYREVRTKTYDEKDVKVVVRKYESSGGMEYFISHESHDEKTLYSLLRLRINGQYNMCVFPELKHCTFIREVHVYGKMICHSELSTKSASQHKGLGIELVGIACDITRQCGFKQICVISGVGVCQYYVQKLGFDRGVYGYLVKNV